jgi:hypothetical protein
MGAHEGGRMNFILRDLLPLTLPSPFLTVIGECFGGALATTVVAALLIRILWRRGKGMYEL